MTSLVLTAAQIAQVLAENPPVVVTPPTDPQPPVAGSSRVVVVPLRYLPPDNTPANKIAYDAFMAALPKVTQAHLTTVFAPLPSYWSFITYGLKALQVTVIPEVELGVKANYCDFSGVQNAAIQAVKGIPFDNLIIVTPYTCSNYGNMTTSGNVTFSLNTSQDSLPMYAHELGHQFGLQHTASRMPTYMLYGGGDDLMAGPSATLPNLRADHKQGLGALTPTVVSGAWTGTLRSIFDFPDALHIGNYTIEYLGDWKEVWINLREIVPNSTYGGSDTTVIARLPAAQSSSLIPGYQVTHIGNGQLIITQG